MSIHSMKCVTLIAAGLLGAGIAGCDKGASPTPATPAASTAGKTVSQDVGVTVPTQEEADAAAAKEINKDNADKAFEDLQKEVSGG